MKIINMLTLIALAAMPGAGWSATTNKVKFNSLDAQTEFTQFIVTYATPYNDEGQAEAIAFDLNRVENETQQPIKYVRHMLTGAHVITTLTPIDRSAASSLMVSLARSSAVVYVEPDLINQLAVTPNDPNVLDHKQWHLYPVLPTSEDRPGVDAGINALAGWDYTIGVASIKVAVIDTGFTLHPDFGNFPQQSQFDLRSQCTNHHCTPWPNGYDFVSNVQGNGFTYDQNDNRPASPLGQDYDAFDPGDWGDAQHPSNWHGTHVLGLVGAQMNNSTNGAGVAPGVRLVPVRALGYGGGGYISDIVEAIKWASGGVTVDGYHNYANVISMSFGVQTPCDSTTDAGSQYLQATQAALANGSVLVAAVGNENASIDPPFGFSPATCPGVIAVGATSRSGKRSVFQTFASNYGSRVDVSAPGGGLVTINEVGSVDDPIFSTLGLGAQHLTGYTFGGLDGTSMATPQVAGLAALVLSRNPSLTPAQVKTYITGHLHLFGQGGLPMTDKPIGLGIIDVAATVAAVH